MAHVARELLKKELVSLMKETGKPHLLPSFFKAWVGKLNSMQAAGDWMLFFVLCLLTFDLFLLLILSFLGF